MRKIALVLTLIATPLLAQSSSPYRIAHTYMLGGDGGWDYIVPDPPNHRLFIGRSDRVMVVDENDGKLLGEVAGIKGAHGTAIVASDGRGFATAGDGKEIVMFDLKTYKPLATIPAADDADRHEEPSPVQRLSQRRDGGLRLPGWQSRGDRPDRHRRRRRGIRSGDRGRLCLERRRDADGDPPGLARQVHRDADAADAARL